MAYRLMSEFKNHSIYPKKFKNNSGQHILEYALLTILVMVGIIVMGPYVIRSWNANVKGIEDSVQDSFQDPIAPSPPGIPGPDCVCAYKPPCEQGPCCGMGGCADTQLSEVWNCSPIGCQADPGPLCTANIACCTTPVPGIIPDDCGTQGCGADEVPSTFFCGGDSTARMVCQFNANCAFQCQGTFGTDFHYRGLCPFDNIGLNNNITPYTTVVPGGCSRPIGSIPKCQVECAPPFAPIRGATQCGCEGGNVYDKRSCPDGFFWQLTPGDRPRVVDPTHPDYNPQCLPDLPCPCGECFASTGGCVLFPVCCVCPPSCPPGCSLFCDPGPPFGGPCPCGGGTGPGGGSLITCIGDPADCCWCDCPNGGSGPGGGS